MKKILSKLGVIIIFIIIPQHQIFAQKQGQERIDSLMKILPTMKEDSNKVLVINDISYTLQSIDPDKGLARGEQGLLLAIKLGFKKGEAGAYNSMGANYWVKHDYPTQQKCFFKALSINEALGDKKETARTIRNIGDIYETEYNYPKALEYYKRALSIALEINEYELILKFQAHIANVYDAQKNYLEALDYFERSIKLSEKLDKKIGIAGYLRRAGLVISEQGNFEKALAYEKRALGIYIYLGKNNPYRDHMAWNLRDIGTIYFQHGDYEQSLSYYRQAFNQFACLTGSFSKDNTGICLAKMGKAYLYLAKSIPVDSLYFHIQLKHAADTLNMAIKILKPGDWTSLTESLKDLSTVYQLMHNYKAALDTYKEYSRFKDSLYNTEIEKKVLINQIEYDYGRMKDSTNNVNQLQLAAFNLLVQEKELDKLRGKEQKIYIIVGFATLCLIAFYFLYRNYLAKQRLKSELAKERIEKKLQEAEHERNISRTTLTALISQMNPHFLFNALNTIQSFIYSNDKKNASNYLGKFSDLTRKILDNSSKKSISLDEEIEMLHLYLDIEKARFGDNFTAVIETDSALDKEEIYFPPMLVQPYVENAIKHGLLHKPGNKQLSISINGFDDGQKIRITIDDNGIGREKSKEINRQKIGHRSFAHTANEKRIDLINQTLGQKITLEFIDKKNENGLAIGTTVIITIPIMEGGLT